MESTGAIVGGANAPDGLPPYLAGLNEQQLAATMASEGYLRVIAGAGTGKTRLLTHRYAYLVQGLGIDPANICCVTFTNKAAGEMRRRIRGLIGEGHDTSLIATYDSLAARILREDIERLFWPQSFQIIDRDRQKEIMAEIYAQHGLKMDVSSFQKVLDRAGAVKGNTDYVPGMITRERRQVLRSVDSQMDALVEAYLQYQKRDFLLDFDDLLMFAQYLLDTCPDIRDRWQHKLNYIQVDEFQDSDPNQVRFVDTLAGFYRNVMVVGDPDQNIFEWRGTEVALLVDFDRKHSPCQTMFLTANYRSTPQVLTCANELIAKNRLRVPKDLEPMRPGGAPVIHLHATSEDQETAWIADRMEQMHREGIPYRAMAVLYRAGYVSRPVERRLMERGIPYEIVGGPRFLNRMEIADTVAYLHLVAFGDDYSFKRVVNTPRRKMGRARVQYLEQLRDSAAEGAPGDGAGGAGGADARGGAGGARPTLLETMEQHLGDEPLKGSGAARFADLVDHLRSRMPRMGVADFVDLVLAESGYATYVRELGDSERLDNLALFKRLAHDFEADAGEEVSLFDFLDALALQADIDPDETGDRVRLMTIHAAKGLEFPCVFLTGMTEDVFPSSRTQEDRKELGLEEERRLCYVALTRARDLLVMTESEGVGNARAPKLPSRFLFEMGEDNYERIGSVSDVLAQRVRHNVERGALPSTDQKATWTGRRIVHPVFGPGTIGEPDSSSTSFCVSFDKLPTPRYLSATFLAKLCGPEDPGNSKPVDPVPPAELPPAAGTPEDAGPQG